MAPAPLPTARPAEIGLSEALKPEVIAAYNRKSTGEKYLINPAKG